MLQKGAEYMTNAKKIKMALAYKGISEAELARQMETSPSALNQRMKTDKFTNEELGEIAEKLGAVYNSYFEFPDGTRV